MFDCIMCNSVASHYNYDKIFLGGSWNTKSIKKCLAAKALITLAVVSFFCLFDVVQALRV